MSFLENEEQPSEKKFRAMFPRYNKAHMPNFSYFGTLSKWPKNQGDVLACRLSITVPYFSVCFVVIHALLHLETLGKFP